MNGRQDTVGRYEPGARRQARYVDRADAGVQLAAALHEYRGKHALVLGIPRGGVPVAYEVARALGADLDVIVARKMGAPDQEELAIGATTADGTQFLNVDLIEMIGVPDDYLREVGAQERAEAQRREERFRHGLSAQDPKGRIVILVDDGLATGATMRAAILSLRRGAARRLVVAVPVGAPEACERIAEEVDELVCPNRPEPFFSVGLHYEAFGQTGDDEVQRLLGESRHQPRNAVG